jgi:putative glutamine amidotransferase
MNTKILIVNDTADMGRSYGTVFEQFGQVTHELELLLEDPQSLSLIVLTGGEDVDPSLYGEDELRQCYTNPYRDRVEQAVYAVATKYKIPMFGICRGAQFLCVMTGGKMVQHCLGHHDDHVMTTKDGRSFSVSSSHHQMMIPAKDCPIIAWAEPKLSKIYLGGNGEVANYNKEVEAVEFPSVKAIGVQYHPEVMSEDSEGFKYFQELVRSLLYEPSNNLRACNEREVPCLQATEC